MLKELLGGMMSDKDKEDAIRMTLNNTLEDIAEELEKAELDPANFIIAIGISGSAPEKGFKCTILKANIDKLEAIPKAMHREITLSEIVAGGGSGDD